MNTNARQQQKFAPAPDLIGKIGFVSQKDVYSGRQDFALHLRSVPELPKHSYKLLSKKEIIEIGFDSQKRRILRTAPKKTPRLLALLRKNSESLPSSWLRSVKHLSQPSLDVCPPCIPQVFLKFVSWEDSA